MDLENVKVGCTKSLSEISPVVSTESFEELKNIILAYYEYRGISSENMCIEYQRFSNANSVLAIKLIEGENSDKENYMFIGTTTSYRNKKPYCDVFMHADAKSAQEALELSRYASRKIVDFFEKTEKDLVDKNITDSEFTISIPFSSKKENKNEKDEQELPRIKRFTKKISTILWKK